MSDQPFFAAALLDPDAPCPAGLTAWNGSDPARRFAVYRNNVIASLIDALAETFPVTLELVGEEFFRAMAGVFVRVAPPRSALLAEYGEGFPDFIENFEPARGVPYLADVARLELLRVRAFHAADADPVSPEQIAHALADPERLPALRVVCHPSLGVLSSRYAVVSLWAAHQGIGDLASVDPYLPGNRASGSRRAGSAGYRAAAGGRHADCGFCERTDPRRSRRAGGFRPRGFRPDDPPRPAAGLRRTLLFTTAHGNRSMTTSALSTPPTHRRLDAALGAFHPARHRAVRPNS